MLQKRTFSLFIVSVCTTILLSFFIYQKLTLLSFINISFVIAGSLLFLSLLTMTVKGGFFDGISYGFRRMFVSKGQELSKKEINEMTPVSELLNFDHFPILFCGLLMTASMLVALFIYYL
ncbi:DUF3899 domain-containing protein [Metabacillus bambusae]|uniref:DUF3899 domain-containing protein n=1 Tax=Metabacillus bambusae TaxID=2795218 RepID=A0ABS3N066_9BACI|nr:DUF3899 domain-containing protein [Metabacillus bambusae]MBO1511619.1 DUF3899 domain-containing protein [Metabacillus bambusae]